MRSFHLFLLLLLALPAVAEDSSWVRNGQWSMRLVKVQYVTDYSDFQKLPWAQSFSGEVRDKTMEHAKKSVFAKEKQVALLTIELKNTSATTVKVGTNRPYWIVRCGDGQQVSNNHSFMRQVSESLKNGMQKEEPLKPGDTRVGTVAFFIPNFTQVNSLFFKAQGHLAKDFGETESLVLKTQQQNVKGGRATTGASQSTVEWVSNGLWKMRITEAKYINTLADYKQLPWNARMTGDAKDKHLNYMSKAVFPKDKRVLLVKIELKNLHPDKKKVGVKRPYWFLHTGGKRDLNNNNSYAAKVPFLLEGGLPQETLLNPNDTVRGWLAFFVPNNEQPKTVYYKSQGHVGKSFGESKSIVLPVP
jgi:hypothetical protein